MKHLLLLVAFLLLASAAPVGAQGVYTPERGSPERRAILDAVRDDAHRALGLSGPLEFYHVILRATGDWALANVEPRRPGGRAIGHCASEDGAYDEGDPNIVALLYRRDGRWHVIESATCATDVWYLHWPDRYGAPHPLGIPAPSPFPRRAGVSPTDDGFLSLRTEPSIRRGQRIARMPSGSEVRVLGCDASPERIEGDWGRWCRVRYGRQEGWAFSAYLYMD